MKILIGLAVLVVITGCAPYRFTVTGGTGKIYTAPDICQALVQCKNSEDTCYVPTSKTVTQDGKGVDESYCKEVKK